MRIEKAKEMVAKLGDLASLSEIIDIKISIGTASSLMCLIKDLHNEVVHLRNVLGRPATGQLVEDHLLIYGNAYIYDGLLLDPTKMVIRRVARPGGICGSPSRSSRSRACESAGGTCRGRGLASRCTGWKELTKCEDDCPWKVKGEA